MSFLNAYERERDSHRTYLPILSPSPSIDPFNMHSSSFSSLSYVACVFVVAAYILVLRVALTAVAVEKILNN